MPAKLSMGGRPAGGIRPFARLSIVAVVLAGSTAFPQTTTVQGKTISGSVVDDTGSPIAGTKINYRNNATTMRDRRGHVRIVGNVINSNIVTGKDGTFTVSGLEPGIYWLCADGTKPNQMKSCEWGFPATQVDLTTAPSAANIKIQVHTGVMLTFVAADSANRIADFAADLTTAAAPGNFRIAVVSGAWFKAANPVSAAVGGVSIAAGARQYSLVVPMNRTYQLLIDTKLNVLNQVQKPVTAGRLDDTITVAAQPVTYNLTVK